MEKETITMSLEDFQVIYDALQIVCTPYTDADIPTLLAHENLAWKTIQRVRSQSQ